MSRWTLRLAAAVAGAVAALAVATAASAHVEVAADKAQAGATNVTVTFDAEAESSSAGIRTVRVVLPAGIAPADISLVKAPSGWKLTTTSDGYQITGATLPTGTNA